MKNNQVILIGNIGRDPEVKQTKSGEAMGNLTLATSNNYFDKNTKDWKDQPSDWHNIRAFGNVAEQLNDYSKGQRVIVTGKLKTDQYDKDGEKKTFIYVLIDSIGLYSRPYKDAPKQEGPKQNTKVLNEVSDDLPF